MDYQLRYRCIDFSPELLKDPKDLNEEEIQEWLETLREMDPGVVGPLKTPTQHPNGPPIIAERFSYGDPNEPLISWQHFAVSESGTKCLLSWRPQHVDRSLVWLEEVPPEPKEHHPPQENIDKGYECRNCKHFSHEQGQEWLHQVTHRFDGAQDQMYRDVMRLTTDKFDVEIPDHDKDFGRCKQRKSLVMVDYPGCEHYTPKKTWKAAPDAS